MQEAPAKKTSRLTKIIIILFGLTGVIAALVFGAFQVTSGNKFCSSCHEMQPEYMTWQASSHSKINCTYCHEPVSTQGQIVAKLKYIQETIEHTTGMYSNAISIKETLPQEICLQCHKPDREINVDTDLKIPHLRHINKGIACVSCHQGVVHGNISERGSNAKTSGLTWDIKTAKAEISEENTRVSMNQCITCHKKNNQPTSCDTCHSNFTKPESHLATDWRQIHGFQARANINQCNFCHSYTNEKRLGVSEVLFNTPEIQYARNNTFCNGCHTSNKPSNHDENWVVEHGFLYQGGIMECFLCHDLNTPEQDYAVQGTYCNKCHGKFARPLQEIVDDRKQ